MEYFVQAKHWSGLPLPPPGDLPDPGLKLCICGALAGGIFSTVPPGKPYTTRDLSQKARST